MAAASSFHRKEAAPNGPMNPMEAMLVAAGASQTPDAEVWPENWDAWRLYMRVATQWRHGFDGPTGLDYSVVYPLIDHMGLSREDWDQMLADLQVIEVAARDQIRGNAS